MSLNLKNWKIFNEKIERLYLFRHRDLKRSTRVRQDRVEDRESDRERGVERIRFGLSLADSRCYRQTTGLNATS